MDEEDGDLLHTKNCICDVTMHINVNFNNFCSKFVRTQSIISHDKVAQSTELSQRVKH